MNWQLVNRTLLPSNGRALCANETARDKDMKNSKTSEAARTEASFYTVKQLADRWQRHERSIQRDIAEGALEAHRFGKSVRISSDDVLLFEAKKRRRR